MKKLIPKSKPAKPKRLNPLALRHDLRLSQSAFWHPLGVTQSGGSRYEAGRKMPPPVAMLLEQMYVKGVDMDQIEARDVAILRYIKQQHPDLYTTLNKAVGNTNKRSAAAT
ncbi:MAG: hypothetical protein A2Z44_05350 [Betaproteobacteria bacterium RBG_19FT_COMBO_58_11]|nr:MAG: hypothetical protein A2Z44_05350 [Betaproteobacteria bacterium RBG_19FT_COMBO_58_11]